jgi:hypothetical protein
MTPRREVHFKPIPPDNAKDMKFDEVVEQVKEAAVLVLIY